MRMGRDCARPRGLRIPGPTAFVSGEGLKKRKRGLGARFRFVYRGVCDIESKLSISQTPL